MKKKKKRKLTCRTLVKNLLKVNHTNKNARNLLDFDQMLKGINQSKLYQNRNSYVHSGNNTAKSSFCSNMKIALAGVGKFCDQYKGNVFFFKIIKWDGEHQKRFQKDYRQCNSASNRKIQYSSTDQLNTVFTIAARLVLVMLFCCDACKLTYLLI